MTEEEVILDQRGIRVTPTSFMVGYQTFDLADVTSASTIMESPGHRGPAFVITIGIFALLVGHFENMVTTLVGIFLISMGVMRVRTAKPSHWIILHKAEGETRSLRDEDAQWINSVAMALNRAIRERPSAQDAQDNNDG